ncbi:MAG: HAD family hydrolase, partial [Angustibacter sp.]
HSCRLPPGINRTTDHLAVLRYASECHPDALPDVERACLDAEMAAARTAAPTDGAHELLTSCATRGQPVVIVSNNAGRCVDAFFERQRWTGLVTAVIGRTGSRPDLMKPHPAAVMAALNVLHAKANTAVLVGDSPSDMIAASAAGVTGIGYARAPERRSALDRAGAKAVVDSMRDLTAAGTVIPR